MSNRVHIIPTMFEDLRTHEKRYGVRIVDDCAMVYDDSWDEIPEDDLEVLARVLKDSDEATSDLLDWIKQAEQGCYLGGSWYTWDQIKHLWEQEDSEEPSDEEEP